MKETDIYSRYTVRAAGKRLDCATDSGVPGFFRMRSDPNDANLSLSQYIWLVGGVSSWVSCDLHTESRNHHREFGKSVT